MAIAQTEEYLSKRINSHKNDVQNGKNDSSALAESSLDNVKVLAKEADYT